MSDILREVQRARDKVPLPSKVEDLFDGSLIKPKYLEHRPARRALERYHRRAAKKAAAVVEDVGIQQAARLPFAGNQLTHRFPWAVMWLKRNEDQELQKYKKLCTNLAMAVGLRNKLHERGVKNATVVSRARSYYIPLEFIGRIPKPWVWCPHCMKPRKYRRVGDETIFAMKKVKVVNRRGDINYDYRERKVALLRCPMCGCTNRNQVYRRSNQPFIKRRFKQGAIRAKRRTKSKLGAGIKRRR